MRLLSALVGGLFDSDIFQKTAKTAINITETSISVGDMYFDAYANLNSIIYRLNPKKYNRYRVPVSNNNYFELEPNITYFIKRKHCVIKVDSYIEKEKLFSTQYIKITFFGKNKYKYREKIFNKILTDKEKNVIKIQFKNGVDDSKFTTTVPVHNFDHIVLEDGVRDHLINGLRKWKNSREWYNNHHLIYKIGILLSGKPGTGKSTIVRCISSMFKNAPIVTLDGDNVLGSIKAIVDNRNKISGTMIVLIEDFDMFFPDRSNKDESNDPSCQNNNSRSTRSNLNAVFQLLDGVFSTDNTIYIATTNYKSKIDPALIRHGRFDIQERLNYFSKEQAIKAIQLLGYDENVLDKLKLKYPVQPSLLQSKVLEYRSNNE